MKFADIPQFTKRGSYQVNMSLRFLEKWLNEQTNELGLQLNPDFQRGHVWNEQQQTAYIEFLFKGGKSNRILYFNYPGWMSDFVDHKGYNEFVCVDGLQRITAILRFLHNEIKAFGCYYNEYEDSLPLDIDMLVNVNNLQTKKEVLTWYIEMNDGGTPHTKEEINRVRAMLGKE